ncbi:hypothetical protein FGO68_gene10722 [Halteria grandinella]|uniref:Uncharacterized protein n=1 Tax=Halteria grandinella TaxID=5974 RepID=A0A8J8NWP0_HALGN|nr:hypothetical protein FGO68_gene10722 [Halteria grandinella]
MRPGPAYQSKLVKRRQIEKEMELHYCKLNSARSITDNNEPTSLRFPLLKSKKKTQEEAKMAEIERENRILLEKIANIMVNDKDVQKSIIESARQESQESPNRSTERVQVPRRVLLNKRQRDLLRLNEENMKIFERLRQQKSHYNVEKWREQSIKHDKLLKIRSEYPEKFHTISQTDRSTVHHSIDQFSSPRISQKNSEDKQQRGFSQKGSESSQGMSVRLKRISEADATFHSRHSNDHVLTLDQAQDQQHSEHDSEDPITENPMSQTVRSSERQLMLPLSTNGSVKIADDSLDQADELKYPEFEMQQMRGVMKQTGSDFQTIETERLPLSPKLKILDNSYSSQDELQQYQHSDILLPMVLKTSDFLDPNRVVLYREDCRDIPYILDEQLSHSQSPPPREQSLDLSQSLSHYQKPIVGQFVVEVSKSKNRVYILAVKIPENMVASVISGKRPIISIATHPRAKMQVIDLTEKQAKKLLNECNSDFKTMVDLLQISFGRIQIKDLDRLLKFGVQSINPIANSQNNFLNNSIHHLKVEQRSQQQHTISINPMFGNGSGEKSINDERRKQSKHMIKGLDLARSQPTNFLQSLNSSRDRIQEEDSQRSNSRSPTKNKMLPQIIAHSGSTKQYIKRHIEHLQMNRIKQNTLVPGKWAVVSKQGNRITKEEVTQLIDQYVAPPQMKSEYITI